MKKLISIILILTLIMSNTLIFAHADNNIQTDNPEIELVENNTYELNGVMYGTLVYLIDNEIYTYDIQNEDGQRVVNMSTENGVKEKLTYDAKDQKVYGNDNSLIATFNMESQEATARLGGTTYSETPIYGSSGDYNQLRSIDDGDVRFSEKVLSAVSSGTFGYATGLITAALLSNPLTGVITGAVVGSIYSFLSYNPKPAAYFTRWKYEHDDIPRYYKFVQLFYWDPGHTTYCDTNVFYSSEW